MCEKIQNKTEEGDITTETMLARVEWMREKIADGISGVGRG